MWVVACPGSHIRISNRARTRPLTPYFSPVLCSGLSVLKWEELLCSSLSSDFAFKPRLKALQGLALMTNCTRLGPATKSVGQGWAPVGRPDFRRESKPALCPRSAWGHCCSASSLHTHPILTLFPQSYSPRPCSEKRAPKPLPTDTQLSHSERHKHTQLIHRHMHTKAGT